MAGWIRVDFKWGGGCGDGDDDDDDDDDDDADDDADDNHHLSNIEIHPLWLLLTATRANPAEM